jgi:hypothetical protein
MKKIGLALFLIVMSMTPLEVFSVNCSEYFTSAKDIDVSVYAVAEETVEGFEYSYTLSSSEKSKQDVWTFLVESLPAISNVSSPAGWDSSIYESPQFWSSDYPDDNIKPGDSLDGFNFQSAGIPAVVTFYSHGWRELPTITEEEMPAGEEEDCPERNIFINAFKGKTIGPTAPPEELVPADFLQGIIDMKHEAMELGWVTNEGIKDSLDMKLEAALKKLQSGNTKAAANILGAFINEVEAQGCESYADCPKGKHLTPEAYALLKFNAQYLIDNLK